MRTRRAFAVLSALALALSGCKGWKEAQKRAEEKREKEKTEATIAIGNLHGQLSKVRDAVRANVTAPTTCPDAEMIKTVDTKRTYGRVKLVTVSSQGLDDLVDKGKTANDINDKLGFFNSTIVTGLAIGPALPKGGYSDNDYRVKEMRINSGKYIGVVRVMRDVRPSVGDREGFEGGSFRANVVVFDYEAALPVCQVTFSAGNSDEVKWKERGVLKKTLEEALIADYVKQIRKQGESAFGRASQKKVDPDW